MPTKCIVLGQENEPVKELKKIEFVLMLDDTHTTTRALDCGKSYDFIELICKGYNEYDLMFAYSTGGRNEGILYLGHWNDGVV